MQQITDFNDNLGTAVLLLGNAGAGKTALGCSLFPRTYVYVADLNFSSGKRWLEKNGTLSNVVGFDTGGVDEKGATVAVNARYDRMFRCINEATKFKDVDAIFIDSATFVEDYIKAKICMAANEASIKLQNYDQWGSYLITWKGLIMQLRQSGKKLVMSCHETKEKDDSDGIFKYQIALDGKIAGKMPALFSDVWRCEVVETNGKHSWTVRCLGNVRHELKNTYGLPAMNTVADVIKTVRATLA